MKTLDQRLAWAGGIVDGEGCITIQLHPSRRRYGNGVRKPYSEYKFLNFQFILCNTNEAMILEFKSILDVIGVTYWITTKTPKNPKHKMAWWLEVKGKRNIERFLVEVSPFFITKKPQADLMLETIRRRDLLRSSTSVREGAYRVYRDEIIQDNITKLRSLNHRGRTPYEPPKPTQDEDSRRTSSSESSLRGVVGPDRELEIKCPPEQGTTCSEA